MVDIDLEKEYILLQHILGIVVTNPSILSWRYGEYNIEELWEYKVFMRILVFSNILMRFFYK